MGSKKGDKQKYNTRSQNKRRRNRDDSDDESDENIVLEMENSSDDYETVSESETDSSYSPPSKITNIKHRIRKNIIESESDDDEDDDDESSEDDDDKSAINPRELRKTIATLFPSNYINKKVKADERESKRTKKESHTKNHKKRSRRYKSDSEDDDDDSEEYYDEDEDNEGDMDDFNIIISALTGGGQNGPDASDKKAIEDDKDEECNSDDEKLFMKETYEPISIPNVEKKESEKKTKKDKQSKRRNKSDKSDASETVDAETEYKDLIELKKQLSEKLAKRPNNKILLNAVDECRSSIRKLIKKSRMKNAKKYYKMVNGEDEEKTGEIEYFKKQLSNKEQLRVIKELNEINEHTSIKKPYRLTLLDSNIPPKYKATVMQKVNMKVNFLYKKILINI